MPSVSSRDSAASISVSGRLPWRTVSRLRGGLAPISSLSGDSQVKLSPLDDEAKADISLQWRQLGRCLPSARCGSDGANKKRAQETAGVLMTNAVPDRADFVIFPPLIPY